MLGIALTGNYNFFNILTIIINLVNFDDEFLVMAIPKWALKLLNIEYKEGETKFSWISYLLYNVIPLSVVMTATGYLLIGLIPEGETLRYLFTIDDLKHFLHTSDFPFYYVCYVAGFIVTVLFIDSLGKSNFVLVISYDLRTL